MELTAQFISFFIHLRKYKNTFGQNLDSGFCISCARGLKYIEENLETDLNSCKWLA